MTDSNKIRASAEMPKGTRGTAKGMKTRPHSQKSGQPPKRALRLSGKARRRLPMLLSFALPFVIACISFSVAMLSTEGRNMPMASDGWHQYYPFLKVFREKLLHGGSMEYSWVSGMGGSFVSLYAYYLASPLYLLSVLVPVNALPQFMTVLTILKLSLAGLFFGWFLRIVYRREEDLMIPFFGLLYAFSAWAAGYYWNIMWLDVFALLPLLIAGTVSLLRDGHFRLYTICLALSLWCNYYIAFFSCIFVLLCFICYNIIRWNGFKAFLRRFLRIGISTVLGIGMACALVIPTMLAMQITVSTNIKEFNLLRLNVVEKAYGDYTNLWQLLKTETVPGIFSAISKVLSCQLPGQHPTKMEGLPNIFCGFSTVLLAVYFLCCKKIPLREKLVNVGLLSFLLLSFILRPLDYIWHGLHFPNMLPYRFSFLFSFVLISMAYRAFTLMDDFKMWHLGIFLPFGALLILNCCLANSETWIPAVLGAMVLVIMAAFFVLHSSKTGRKNLALVLLCLIMTCEMVVSLAFGIDEVGLTTQVNKQGETIYPRKNEGVQALLNYVNENDDSLFYRTEVTGTQTLNDGALNGFNGVSIFNSSANANFNRLTRSFGLSSWVGSNRFLYYESSPFTNTMCGVKYLLDRDGKQRNLHYNTLLAEADGVNLLQCDSYIAPAFMTESTLGDFVREKEKYNPIWEQEDMFRMATGVEAPLYDHLTSSEFDVPEGCRLWPSGTSGTQYSYDTKASENDSEKLSIIYPVEEDGLYVATTIRPHKDHNKVNVYCDYRNRDGGYEKLFDLDIKVRCLFCVGSFHKGDILKFEYELPGDKEGVISLDLARQNDEVYDQGYEALADEPFEITDFRDGYVKGNIRALKSGLFYSTVPYEPGWTVTVDGKPVEVATGFDPKSEEVRLTDAVISFPLEAGNHEIEMKYSAPGLKFGIIVSILSLAVFVLLCILLRKRPVLLPEPENQQPRNKKEKPFWLFTAGALVLILITAGIFLIQLQGAKKGYAVILPLPADTRDDKIFLLLAVLLNVLVPVTLWLIWKAVRTLLQHYRRKLVSKASEQSEAEAVFESLPEDSENQKAAEKLSEGSADGTSPADKEEQEGDSRG